MTMEIVRYKPTPKQAQFHIAVDNHTITGFISGVNAGKTTAGFCEALRRASTSVCSGMIVTPNDGMFTRVVRPIIAKWLPNEWIDDSNKVEKWIRLKNGSMIWWGSGHDPLSLEGTSLQWCWLDEAKNYPNDDVFNIMSARIGRDGRGGKMWITTTPIGLYHWLYDVFVGNRQPNTTFIKASTRDNIYADEDYYKRLSSLYTGVYAEQQLEGKFVSFEGLVYDTFDLIGNVSNVQYDPDLPTYWAVDDGWASGSGVGTPSYHPRVILVCQQTKVGGFNVVYEYLATHELPEVSIKNVLEQFPRMPNGKYRLPDGAYIDSSAQELKRRMVDVGILCAKATHTITDGVKVMRRYIMDGQGVRQLQIHPSCKGLIRELQTYRWGNRLDGSEPAPVKVDDHSLDALRYVLYAHR